MQPAGLPGSGGGPVFSATSVASPPFQNPAVRLLMAGRAVSGIHRHFEKATLFLTSVLKILDYPKN